MSVLSVSWMFRYWMYGCRTSRMDFSFSSHKGVFMSYWHELSILSFCCSDSGSDTGQMAVIDVCV